MGFLDRFRKKKSAYPLPAAYKDLISESDYSHFIELSLQYHQEHGYKVKAVREGEILVELNNETQHRYLDNIVRLVAHKDRLEWKALIYEQFAKLKDNSAAYDFFYKDYEHARPLLRVMVKPSDIALAGGAELYIHRQHIPGTYTFLVLEFEQQFRYIMRDDVREWGISEDELIQTAIANMPDDEIEIKQYEYNDTFPVFVFFSGDYSASLTLDLENRVEVAVGKYGSLLAIPTKGTAFVHPVERNDIAALLPHLQPTIEQFYHEDPGPISPGFYWYYQGHFEALPATSQGYALPQSLIALFEAEK